MEIKEIYKRTLQNMEHFQFASHVIAMCEESGIEKIKAMPAPFLSLERKTYLLSQAGKKPGSTLPLKAFLSSSLHFFSIKFAIPRRKTYLCPR